MSKSANRTAIACESHRVQKVQCPFSRGREAAVSACKRRSIPKRTWKKSGHAIALTATDLRAGNAGKDVLNQARLHMCHHSIESPLILLNAVAGPASAARVFASWIFLSCLPPAHPLKKSSPDYTFLESADIQAALLYAAPAGRPRRCASRMKFLVDNQLPVALAKWMQSAGVQAQHVLDIGLEHATDADIWDHALTDGSIIVSKDDDFFLLANRANDVGRLLWVRVGNCRTNALLQRFTAAWLGIY